MNNKQIINHCVNDMGMSYSDAEWVAGNLYNYEVPDFSEWSQAQINDCFRSVLWFRGKTNAQIEAALTA